MACSREQAATETTVMTLPDGLDCVARSQERRLVVLIAFGGGDVEVRDFAIEVGGIASCEAPWLSVLNEDGSGFEAWDLDLALQFAPGIAPLGSCPARGTQNVRVDGLSIEGIFPAYFQPFRVYRGFFGGLVAGGDVLRGCPDSRSTGDVVVTNSSFSRMPQPVDLVWMDDSTVRFGVPGAGNHIRGRPKGSSFKTCRTRTWSSRTTRSAQPSSGASLASHGLTWRVSIPSPWRSSTTGLAAWRGQRASA